MTGDELHDARSRLGYTLSEMAQRLRLSANGRTALREMESGKREISGPISVAVELMLSCKAKVSEAYNEGYDDGLEAAEE